MHNEDELDTREEDARELEYLQKYVSNHQKRRPRAQRIDNLLSRLMAGRGYAQIRGADDLQASWREAAGEALSGQSRCGVLRRGVLQVVAANSAALQEINFQKEYLIRQLNKSAGKSKIKDLRCRIGAV